MHTSVVLEEIRIEETWNPRDRSSFEYVDAWVQYGFVKDTLKSVLAINCLTPSYILSAQYFASLSSSPSAIRRS
jgi:hypothetical protein